MKRIRIILGLLLLGAIINIAVAWACAFWSYTTPDGMLMGWEAIPQLESDVGWFLIRKQAFGATHVQVFPGFDSGAPDDDSDILPNWSSLPDQMKHAVDRTQQELKNKGDKSPGPLLELTWLMQKGYGWPCRSLHWDWSERLTQSTTLPTESLQWGIPLSYWVIPNGSRSYDERRALPLGVLPFGFMMNTLFFAALTGLSFIGTTKWRRLRRIQNRRCLKCAYDLRGSPPESRQCPECGRRLASNELA